jgi:hypothetical protein
MSSVRVLAISVAPESLWDDVPVELAKSGQNAALELVGVDAVYNVPVSWQGKICTKWHFAGRQSHL